MLKWIAVFGLIGMSLTAQEEPAVSPFSVDTLARSPWGAVVRSLVVPGWGQAYNGSWAKVPVFIAGDVSMMWIYQVKDRKVKRIEKNRKQLDRQLKNDPFLTAEQKDILQSRFNGLTGKLDNALTDRNLYGWLFAISHLLGMVDAYVDAHLFLFNTKMDVAFSGLPGYSGAAMQISW